MSEMIVQVRNKILRRIGGVNHFVSHNKDYTIQFQFDESWNNVRTKMAVFAYEDGEYGSEIFDGDTCKVPELPREGRILIGVKAGEDLSTELLCIPVCKSADDVITDEYDEPDPKIYEQILDIINNLWNGGTTVYPSPVRFLAAPSTAKVGDLIRVKEVDENGEIKETEAVDVEKELVVVNITKDADGVLHADMTYDEINPLRYTHAVYAKWASGMYPYSTSARMYFGEDLKNVFVFSSSMAGMENWRIAIAQDGSVKINSYELELVWRKVQTIDETTGTGDDSEKNYPSAKAVYDAIGQKIDKNQGTKNAGKILGIGADGNVTPQNKPAQALAGAAAPTTATAGVVGQEYYVIVNNAVTEMYVCTAVANGTYTWDKVEFGGGNTTGVSLGITGASVGQIAKITAVDSADKPTSWEAVDMPNRLDVTVSMGDNGLVVSHKFAEIKAAYDAGRAVQLINIDTLMKYSLMDFSPGNIEGVTNADFKFIDGAGDIWIATIDSNNEIDFFQDGSFVTLYGDVPQDTPKAITYSAANGIGYADFIPYIEIPSTGDELKERLAIIPEYFYVMPNAYAPFVLKNLVNPYTLTRLSYSEPEFGTENNTFEASYLVTDSLGQQIKATCQVLLTESGLGDLVWNFEVRDSLIVKSSTEGSAKKFKITVDDSGTISATEITD